MNVFRRFARSIFFKLVLIFVATAIIMALAVGSIIRYAADERPFGGIVKKNMAQYSMYLIDEIGSPPELEKAQRLADKLDFSVRITSDDLQWASEPRLMTHIPREYRDVRGYSGVRSAHHRGRIAVEVSRQDLGYLFVFGRQGRPYGGLDGEIVVLVLLAVGAVLTLSYLTVRWLFMPLGWLTAGMQKMGRGDLDATVSIRKHDELGELAATFNDMSEKIREQVRSRQQLLLDVSHELRSPLTRMKVATEFIDDVKVKERISGDLDEMEAMTREILESERLDSEQGGLNREALDLKGLVEDIVSTYSGTKPGVDVVFEEPAVAVVDPERVRALLRNLIDNALKYSGVQQCPVEVRLNCRPDCVQIIIEDFGEGIPNEDLPLIFEPFYRVDKSRHRATGGFGLGLSLCQKIMVAHGGGLEVESRVGQGTKFIASFPLPGSA
jgi:signal transduction histidine kinase